MKTFAKSFIGAVLGTVLVLLVVWSLINNNGNKRQIN